MRSDQEETLGLRVTEVIQDFAVMPVNQVLTVLPDVQVYLANQDYQVNKAQKAHVANQDNKVSYGYIISFSSSL